MTEFTVGDWIFIGGGMGGIVVCIALSDLRMRK